MIISTRNNQGEAPHPRGLSPVVIIESNDSVFAEKIANTLDQWGFCHQHRGAETSFTLAEGKGDVLLLDIRDMTEEAFGHVYSIRQQSALVEVVLINKTDNVTASIAGMKAGAVDEIIVPIDTGILQTIISDACKRVQTARAKTHKKPLLTRFSEAMMVATFAQAGDFEGALELLDKSSPNKKNK